MKKFLSFVTSLILYQTALAQHFDIDTIFTDKISIRAITVYDGKVWYAGTDSKFGYVNLNNKADRKQIKLSDDHLQFRALAQTRDHFFAINVESPARFFKIDKKTLQVSTVFRDENKDAFYDALAFDGARGVALGDPYDNCPTIQLTHNSGKDWRKVNCDMLPKMLPGEAHFAASNSNIVLHSKQIFIVTGGTMSRVLYSADFGKHWTAFGTPILSGETAGIYAMDKVFEPKPFAIVVGGDYRDQSANQNNIAVSRDGKNWKTVASGANSGYRTDVKIRPGSGGKEIISVGDGDISYSNDYGETWRVVADKKNLYAAAWVDARTVVVAGKDSIIRLRLIDGAAASL